MKENQSLNAQSSVSNINQQPLKEAWKEPYQTHQKKASYYSVTSLKLTSSEAKLLSDTLSREMLNQKAEGDKQPIDGAKIDPSSKPADCKNETIVENPAPPLSARVVSQANLIQQL